ncbi:MAG: SpoIIIAC/SpoIIIAD family protein [Oscillospiraceae bacterium]|nr:SpoIIIAC/SpoIIIAD family protein [Oscillospiraceae bacterium]
MNDVIRVAAAGIIAAVCALVVRKQTPELSLLLVICGSVIILLFCTGALSAVKQLMDELSQTGGLTAATVKPVMKVTGIAVITRLASDLCQDAGEKALAGAVEMAGSLFALLAVIPLMSAVLELITQLL